MTISTTDNKVNYLGNGVLVEYYFNFKVFAEAHMQVYLDDVFQIGGYTVLLNEDQDTTPGGTVTFDAAPASGVSVTLLREVPETQLVDYQPYDPFPAETHESALDKLTMISQQLSESIGRAIQQPVSGAGEIKIPAYEAGKAWQWSDTVINEIINTEIVLYPNLVDLLDTPDNYAGSSLYNLRVNAAGNGIEFSAASGQAATSAIYDYIFKGDGTGDPLAGNIGTNNADPSLVTELRISNTDNNTDNRQGSLLALSAGDIVEINDSAGSEFNTYTVAADPVDNTTYTTLTVTYSNSNGTITVDNAVSVSFTFVPTKTFSGLEDTPADYTGSANKVVSVNAGEDALEFSDISTSLFGKNLIINGTFKINQREVADRLTTSYDGYSFDRWRPSAGDLYQGVIEDDIVDGNHVMSWDSDATCEYMLADTSLDAAAVIAGWTGLPVTKGVPFNVTGSAGNNLWVRFIAGVDGLASLDRVKLERGDVATQCACETYAETLNVCQFYFERMRMFGYAIPGQMMLSSAARYTLYYARKRANPTIELSALSQSNGWWPCEGGGNFVGGNFNTNNTQGTQNQGDIRVNALTGTLIHGQTTFLYASGSNAWIDVNAEL